MSSDELTGRLVLDAGVLVEMLAGTLAGTTVRDALAEGRTDAKATRLALVEAEYVMCRKFGRAVASSKSKALRDSNYVSVVDDLELDPATASLKCERRLSLGDCSTLAAAKISRSPVLFAHREKELAREMARKPFDIEIRFLARRG